MKLSAENQELLDRVYPNGYEVKEKDRYHVLLVKIIKTNGRHNKLQANVQVFNKKDWGELLKQVNNGFNLAAITGYDEFVVIHDPTVQPEPKPIPQPKPKSKPGPKPSRVESHN